MVDVVDDDADVRGLIAGHLRRTGYQVWETANSAEAIDLVRQEQPGFLLMDIRMPVMDGIAALQALRANKETRSLPVVMMTASPGLLENSRSILQALRGMALLTRPGTAEDLAVAITRGMMTGCRR